MSNMRYLLDEHVDPLFRSELLKRAPTLVVWKIGDPGAPTRGTLDPEILPLFSNAVFEIFDKRGNA